MAYTRFTNALQGKYTLTLFSLTPEEQVALVEADRVLVQQARAFSQEPARFVDLTAHPREYGIPPSR